MHRPLSAGVRQSVHIVNNGLQISPSAPVQKSTAHKVNVRRRSATGKLFDVHFVRRRFCAHFPDWNFGPTVR